MRLIRNSVMNRGYAPSVRELMESMGYSSPRSAAMIINSLIDGGYLRRKKDNSLELLSSFAGDESNEETVDIPIVGMAACGMPMLAEENIEDYISVSTRLARPPHKYFIVRAKGDSMNMAGINDMDSVLIKRTQTAKNGDLVVALINNEATIKQYWQGEGAVLLKPVSSNKTHRPIVVADEFMIQGIVVRTIPGL